MRPIALLWLLTGLFACRVVGQALVAFLHVLAAYVFVWGGLTVSARTARQQR